jgi:hypothetical protein
MDIITHITIITIITGFFFLLRWSENPLIYGSIIIISSIGLIISLISGVYIITGEEQTYTYYDTCDNTTAYNCIDKITTIPQTPDLVLWKYIFNLGYIAYLISAIIFWTLANPKEED